MPTEYRRVVFPNHELRQALLDYESDGEQAMPPGHIVSVAILDSPANTVQITLLDTAANTTYTADFSASHIAAALIHFCGRNQIPIPRHSRKSLRLMGDNMSLDIVIRERTLVDLASG